MHYIGVDLEWNQPMSFDSSVFRQVGDRLVFEMIQIGAVKVDDQYQVVDSISIPIRPQYYVKIHPRIRKMTQLGAEELSDAPTFLDAMAQFTAWCGEEYTLLTWGCDDISVWKQNMDFFGCTEPMPPICDIQRLFSDVNGCRDRKGLKVAMEMLGIEPDAARYFHNALHDAYYTALVFARLPQPEDVLKYPHHGLQALTPEYRAAVSPELAIVTCNQRETDGKKYIRRTALDTVWTVPGFVHLMTDGEMWVCDRIMSDVKY